MILSENILQNVIDAALSGGADFAEVFLQDTYISETGISESKASTASVSQLYGAGIRLFYGHEIIYTHTNDLSEAGLIDLAKKSAAALKGKQIQQAQSLTQLSYKNIHEYGKLPWEIDKKSKFEKLMRFDKAARSLSPMVSQVEASIKESHKKIQIANSLGILGNEVRNYVNIGLQTFAEDSGERATGSQRKGRLATSEYLDSLDYEEIAKEAAQEALTSLTAEYAPAGEMPVVIDKGFGGVIFHEACGHGLETTSVAKDASVFCGKLGEKIAETCVTAIDDGTEPNTYGSLCIDDEGYPSQKTVLIEKGVLKSYIVDQMGAKKTGYMATGSGRRQDYRFAPASRMRNTYIAAGDSTLEEMISDVDNGIFCKKLGGGSVTPSTGDYNFAAQEAYLIKNGKIDKPIKGASLIGTGIETLSRITKVGNELELAPGTCGSVSGWVPVTVGQPAILVSKLVVGGRS